MADTLLGLPVIAVDGPTEPHPVAVFGDLVAMHNFSVPCDEEGRIWIDDHTYVTFDALKEALAESHPFMNLTLREKT